MSSSSSTLRILTRSLSRLSVQVKMQTKSRQRMVMSSSSSAANATAWTASSSSWTTFVTPRRRFLSNTTKEGENNKNNDQKKKKVEKSAGTVAADDLDLDVLDEPALDLVLRGNNNKNDDKKKKKVEALVVADLDLDLFGVLDEDDETDHVGKRSFLGPPSRWPPHYQRDKATGRLSTKLVVQAELDHRDRRVLKADALERDQLTLEHVERHFLQKQKKKKGKPIRSGISDGDDADKVLDEDNEDDLVDEWGKRVRETDMSLNVLGRSVAAQQLLRNKEVLDDGSTLGRDKETGFSTPFLTQAEFETFQQYLKKTRGISNIDKDDLPVQEGGGGGVRKFDLDTNDGGDDTDDSVFADIDPDDAKLSLQWLTQRAQRQMDDLASDDNPYSDLMPGDLSPVRLVNRKRAKPLPRELLHHNNVELLKYFLTPTGQIQNRVKTRLGAKDQRKISKLVKRARAIGLIPHVGQFKVEQHGWIHAKDIHQDREWEKELAQRGLVVSRRNNKDKSSNSSSSSS